jgi:hypothetical protein
MAGFRCRPTSKWCGEPKARTLDCDECELLRVIDGQEWCIFGVGKVLDDAKEPRACVLFDPKTKKPRKKWPLHSRVR